MRKKIWNLFVTIRKKWKQLNIYKKNLTTKSFRYLGSLIQHGAIDKDTNAIKEWLK